MKRLYLILILFFLSAPAWASTHYIAPTAAGSGNASSCANAAAESTYGGGTYPGGVAAGDTIYACPGTYTSTFFIGGNGTALNPITFQCDPSALFSAAVWSGSYGAISTGGGGASAWIVNGCGIQNTANGTGLANSAASKGMYLICNGFPCVVENSTVSNIYINNPSVNDNDTAGASTQGIEIIQASSASGGCVQWIANTVHDVEGAIYGYALPGTTSGCFLMSGANLMYNSGNPVQIFTDSSTISLISLVGFTCHDGGNWSTTSDFFHQECVHIFSSPGSTISAVDLHNDFSYGSWNFLPGQSNFQGQYYVESNGGTITYAQFFNLIGESSTEPDGAQIECSQCDSAFIANNTLVGLHNTDVQGGANQGISNRTAPGVTVENNIISQFYISLAADSGGGSFAASNFNDFYDIAEWTYHGTFYSSLAAFTTGTGFDANSVVGNPLLSTAYVPLAGSPAINLGTNLTSQCTGMLAALCFDLNGNPRPSTGAWTAGAVNPSGGAPELPQEWTDNNECTDGSLTAPTYELNLATQTWVGTAPGSGFHVPYWTVGTPTQAGLQSALNDIEAYRTANGSGIIADVPPGLYTGSSGLTIPQSSSSLATSCLVVRSTQDASLPDNRIVCAHGPQDNLPTSSDPGIENADCAGDKLSYQLGPAIIPIPSGPFTLANGTATNTSNYDDVQYMWTAECSGTNCAPITACSPLGASSSSIPPSCASTTLAPDHWLIEDMEARMSAGNTGDQNVVNLTQTFTETSTTEFPTHIHLRKIWQHGDWASLTAGRNSVSAGISFVCSYCSIVDSQTSENLRPGAEGHSVLAQGPGPYKINHNWFEGQSSGIFAGGWSMGLPFAGTGYVNFTNVEMRRNRLTFPYSWLGVGTIPSGPYSGQSIVRKNVEEIKEGQLLLYDGNILENADSSGGQGGPIADFNVRNCSGCGATKSNYQAIISDLTFTNNIGRNTCEGFEFDKSDIGNGAGVTYGIYRAALKNNLFYNISDNNPNCTGYLQGVALENSTGNYWQGTVTENSAGTGATFVANCSTSLGTCIGQIASATVSGCSAAGTLTFSAPNLSGGVQATGTFNGSCVVTLTNPGTGYTSVTVSATSGTASATINASSTAPTSGFQVLDILAGDPAAVTMCPTSALNNVTTATYGSLVRPSERAPLASAGSAPWNGTPTSANLTVSYPWATTANLSDSSGYCTITSVQGGPANFSFDHNTVVTDATYSLTSNNGPTAGGNYQVGALIRDSILLGSGWNTGEGVITEGTPTETFNYDRTTLSADHVAWPTRTASLYTEYGNNPNYPDSAGCTGAGCSPPSTMRFPATPFCTGSGPTPACLGFVGAEYYDAPRMLLAPQDYHDLGITPGTYYAAGGTGQASDGTNMGSLLPLIDAAETGNLYVCASPCGSGPYPDALAVNFTVNVAVYGSGSVADNDSQIACPIACTGTYAMGFTAILSATPGAGYVFAGWSGSGGCTGTGSCSLTTSANPTATFTPVSGGVNVNLSSGTAMSAGTAVTQ